MLSDDDLLTLARWAVLVEEHYSKLRAAPTPMDIEWAKDGRSGELIRAAHAAGRKIGICGQAPSDYPEFAQFLVAQGIDSLSLNPDSLLKTMLAIADVEKALAPVPIAP